MNTKLHQKRINLNCSSNNYFELKIFSTFIKKKQIKNSKIEFELYLIKWTVNKMILKKTLNNFWNVIEEFWTTNTYHNFNSRFTKSLSGFFFFKFCWKFFFSIFFECLDKKRHTKTTNQINIPQILFNKIEKFEKNSNQINKKIWKKKLLSKIKQLHLKRIHTSTSFIEITSESSRQIMNSKTQR